MCVRVCVLHVSRDAIELEPEPASTLLFTESKQSVLTPVVRPPLRLHLHIFIGKREAFCQTTRHNGRVNIFVYDF